MKYEIVLMFLLLTLNIIHTFSIVSTVNLEHVNVSRDFANETSQHKKTEGN